MEWIPIAVSLFAAVVSVLAAVRSYQESQRATAVQRERKRGRAVVSAAITLGNALAEDYRRTDLSDVQRAELDGRYALFEKTGSVAVRSADPAWTSYWDKPLMAGKPWKHLNERLGRLHYIFEKL